MLPVAWPLITYMTDLANGAKWLRNVTMGHFRQGILQGIDNTPERVRFVLGDITETAFRKKIFNVHRRMCEARGVYGVQDYVVDAAEDTLRYFKSVLAARPLVALVYTSPETEAETKAVSERDRERASAALVVQDKILGGATHMQRVLVLANAHLAKIASELCTRRLVFARDAEMIRM